MLDEGGERFEVVMVNLVRAEEFHDWFNNNVADQYPERHG